MADSIVMEVSKDYSRSPSCTILLSDFANMLKAFMGSNYLNIAYAFSQSGLVPGIIGLIIIASLTDHCCLLIVKCKHRAIQVLINRQMETPTHSASLQEGSTDSVSNADGYDSLRQKMIRNITYGDVGRIALGNAGLLMVNISLLFTQFGFCVGYFIFLGNTIFHLFPYTNTTLDFTDFPSSKNSSSLSDFIPLDLQSSNSMNQNFSYANASSTNASSIDLFSNMTSTTVEPQMISFTNLSHYVGISQAPDLRLLVISPLPFFIGFAFLRDVRHLGFVSVAADVSIFAGCIVTMIVLNIGFEQSDTWYMYEWAKFPVFFGMVTSSFEGIGTIIPIESSMEGNRHNFTKFLNAAVFIMSSVLLTFGVLGYLRYGEDTAQMLNKNMPDGSVGIMINICLCIGVVLTFPLQIYPVIELTEIFLFGNGRICGPKASDYKRIVSRDDDDDDVDQESLLPVVSDNSAHVATTISDEVSTWKRNLLRVILVVLAGGLAVLLRDFYAYVSAFIGAVGSSVLAYILPCMFHLKLSWSILPRGIIIKNILIIIFGIVASLVSLYTTVQQVIERAS